MSQNEHNPHALWPAAPGLRRTDISFTHQGNDFVGHLVAPPEDTGPRPLVLVIHNYQGLKFFDVDVAEYMARLGYVGLAIDMYGLLVPAEERIFPQDTSKIQAFQKKCFDAMAAIDHDHGAFRDLLAAWIAQGLRHEAVDASFAPAAIGYCFGGMAVIEGVRGGLNLSGVVSLHGLLQTGEDPNPAHYGVTRPTVKPRNDSYNTDTIVMIENGANDHLVPEESKQRFFAEMDAAGVDWVFNQYAQTPHGFALPPTLGPPGHLFEAADRRSTMNMLNLFREVFPGVPQNVVSVNAAGTAIPM
ncbi:MAG: dienelactone hydrolase [Candidatus Pseudothioglobus sp.]|jgi:dienelactone hydrolase